ncbi:hypothetical protein J4204_04125 [Candidatus Woesearchaeota archaeon]|nr:hypothetical protein [Candidatus Woesearchaeota archaeon]
MSLHKMKQAKIILYMALMMMAVNAASAEKYFVLDVNHILGSVTFNKISLKDAGGAVRYADTSGFLVKSVSFKNEDIDKIYFGMAENKNYLIYVPYSKDAARIEVYNLKNSKIMDIDVSSFADTCGNSLCEEHESYESCTKDCSSGGRDDFCDGIGDEICDPDCSPKTDADCAEKETGEASEKQAIPKTGEGTKERQLTEAEKEPSNYLWILLALFVVMVALIFFLIKKRKENKIIESLRGYISENIRRGFTLQQIKDALFREGYKEKEIDKAVKAIGS